MGQGSALQGSGHRKRGFLQPVLHSRYSSCSSQRLLTWGDQDEVVRRRYLTAYSREYTRKTPFPKDATERFTRGLRELTRHHAVQPDTDGEVQEQPIDVLLLGSS